MAPPVPAPASKAATRQQALVDQKQSQGATSSSAKPGKTAAEAIKDDKEVSSRVDAAGIHINNSLKLINNSLQLATVFKSDLENIRTLVTCSICDQLLYEPWTLGCGHTYCYSVRPTFGRPSDFVLTRSQCLCNWFIPNKRKKSCPECRTRVKQIPAPNYLVKQMIEVFTKRSELMPSDESIDQHTQKRAEEIAEVDRDRNAPAGLFKGAFPANGGQGHLFRDEQDGVWRCPGCHHEHEGGPNCQHCGYEMEEDDFAYDMYDDMDDEDEGLELDEELELELEADLDIPDRYFDVHLQHAHGRHRHFYHHNHYEASNSDNSDMESEEDDEDSGSLHEFVAPDSEDDHPAPQRVRLNNPANQPITISDDEESDEGGAVSNRMPRRRARAQFSPTPSVVEVTDNGTNGSEAGDQHSEAELLRDAGWSPLDQGNESEAEEHVPYREYRFRDYTSSDQGQSEDDSDTETMVGNGGSDDEEDRSREQLSETPTYGGPPYIPHEHHYESLDEDGDGDDDDSEAGFSSVYDRDGDTEMSVSPRANRGVSVDIEGYDYAYGDHMSASPSTHRSDSTDADGYGEEADYPDEPRSASSAPPVTDDEPDPYENPYQMYGDLGVANDIRINEVDGDSDDDEPLPARRRRRFNQVQVQQEYDPRISRMFADHQQSLRGDQAPARMVTLAGLSEDARRIEPRNRSTAYRHQPQRRVDPLRSSRSPSANRVVASSSRTSRPPRQYHFRG
ncbi:putative RING finger protein [Lachnellula suecica]|uniref:Putative RING finger protein n=1 Tax=Lachnellula suecica TaxID=602035 RepID=A0A8T9CBS9_9HELO|nr:putative RING finger protein [Lachnellula suecica]